MVLLHRPFIKSRRTATGIITGVSNTKDSHYAACKESAEWIAAIFRNYKMHYGLVSNQTPIYALQIIYVKLD